MFVGHYAAAFGAKAAFPRAPLWSLVGAAQLLDLGFSGLLIAGVEKYRVDMSLPGNPFDLYQMPWTHSLPAAIVWSLAAAGVAILCKLPARIAAVIGSVVFSHWILDFLVHRPDLELWFGGDKVGLGLWNAPVAEMGLEMGLLALCAGAWIARRKEGNQAAWPALLFLGLLVALGIMFVLPAPPESPMITGISGLILFTFITALAWPIDRAWRAPDAD